MGATAVAKRPVGHPKWTGPLICGHDAPNHAYGLCARCYNRWHDGNRVRLAICPKPAAIGIRLCKRCQTVFTARTESAAHCSLWCAYPRY